MHSAEFNRKKKSGFGYKDTDRDKSKFYKVEIKQLNSIKTEFTKVENKYKNHVQPNLIFKINLNQSVSDEIFRKEVGRSGIHILKSSSDKRDYWVAFSEDKEFTKFQKKLDAYSSQNKRNFFTAIEKIGNIPVNDKIGDLLRKRPLQHDEIAYLDLEIWKMEEKKLNKFLKSLEKYLVDHGGRLLDTMVTNNFCLTRVQMNKDLLNEILILPDIARVDRPPEVEIAKSTQIGIEEFEPIQSPDEECHGILVVDSGVRRHPLLENAIKHEMFLPIPNGKITSVEDDAGHGTEVAGVALYGDVGQCILNKRFLPEAWIYSAKVLYRGNDGRVSGDPEKLFHGQLKDAIEKIIPSYSNCKIVNISFASDYELMSDDQMQFNLATLLDELCEQYRIIIVVCVGNYDGDKSDYPNYLLDSSNRVKIANPSSSALALSIGSIYRNYAKGSEILELPSPFTRIGPGFHGMIKPEIVEYGGKSHNDGVTTLNPNWVDEGRLFRNLPGTSYSTPKVANHLVKILNHYPSFSPNLVTALLLSSATIPKEKPGILAKVRPCDSDEKQMKIYNLYGYGKPNIENALYSSSNRVLFIEDDVIKLNTVRLFPLTLPTEFVTEAGNRTISISLAFNPPVNKNRASYLGVVMELHLFKNASAEEIESAYGELNLEKTSDMSDSEPLVPKKIRNLEIKLRPGANIRKRGVHQKGTVTFVRKPQIDTENPLILVLICRNRGWVQEGYEQSYGIVVSIEHSKEIDLYNELRNKNVQRARIR